MVYNRPLMKGILMSDAPQLTSIRHVEEAILSGNGTVLKMILQELVKMTEADGAVLYRVAGAHLIVECTSGAVDQLADQPQAIPLKSSPSGAAIRTKMHMIVPDVRLY